MAVKKPACSSAKNTATSPPGVDADKGICGRLSGDCVLTLTFNRSVILDEEKYDGVKPLSGAMAEETTHPLGITIKIVGIEKGTGKCIGLGCVHLYPQLLNSCDYRSHHVHPLVHPGIFLALVVVGCRGSGELRPSDLTVQLTLEYVCRWEYRAVTGNCYCHHCTLSVIC